MFIDSHCHLYDEKFADDIEQVIADARAKGVNKMLLPNCDSSTIEAMYEVEKKFPESCHAMMGLHPCYVKENNEKELAAIHNELQKRKFIAIGEIGLDFYWDKSFIEEQKKTLRLQIEWALEFDYPIVLHTRDSIDETIAIVQEYTERGLRGVFHCFGGSAEQATTITELGFYLGIGGVLTFKNSNLRENIKHIPLDKIMLETDAPYLAPSPHRGKRNESAYIETIAECLSSVLDLPLTQVADTTTKNCTTLFGL